MKILKIAMIPVSIITALLCFLGIWGPYFSELTTVLTQFIVGFEVRNILTSALVSLPVMFVYSLFPLGLMVIAILSIKFKSFTIPVTIMSFVYSAFLLLNALKWINELAFYNYGLFPWVYFAILIATYLLRYFHSLLIVFVSTINLVLFIVLSALEYMKSKKNKVTK